MEKKILAVIVFSLLLFFLSYVCRNRKFLSNVLMAGASTLTILLFVEFVYRTFFLQKMATDNVRPVSLYMPDSLLGYKYNQPSVYTIVKSFSGEDTVYNTSYTILNDTFNSGTHFNFRKGYNSNSGNKEAVFLGCSLTFGQGLADSQTLPYYYGAAANVSTVNMACIGYGIHQVYQLFNLKFSQQDNHNRIFIYPFFYDHILRANGLYNWNNSGPFWDIQDDTLVDRGPLYKFRKLKGDKWSFYLSLFGSFKVIKDNLHQIAYGTAVKNLSTADYDRCFLMLKDMAGKIAASGGRLVILNWGIYNKFNTPLKYMSKEKVERNLDSLSRYGAMVIPVSSIINLADKQNYIPSDGHPAAATNQVIATWMAKNIKL